MNLILKNPKNVYAIIVMYSFGMICVALFMEHMMNLEPCILCYMQRGSVILIGLFALLGLLINSSNLINFKLNLYLILEVPHLWKPSLQKRHTLFHLYPAYRHQGQTWYRCQERSSWFYSDRLRTMNPLQK